MNKNLQGFGENLKNIRINKGITLREACRMTGYDPSNWSKIERGKISPPSDENILHKWAKVLGIKNKIDTRKFIDEAIVVQGIIPEDVLSHENIAKYLPAFFRILRNKKSSRREICELIELIHNA